MYCIIYGVHFQCVVPISHACPHFKPSTTLFVSHIHFLPLYASFLRACPVCFNLKTVGFLIAHDTFDMTTVCMLPRFSLCVSACPIGSWFTVIFGVIGGLRPAFSWLSSFFWPSLLCVPWPGHGCAGPRALLRLFCFLGGVLSNLPAFCCFSFTILDSRFNWKLSPSATLIGLILLVLSAPDWILFRDYVAFCVEFIRPTLLPREALPRVGAWVVPVIESELCVLSIEGTGTNFFIFPFGVLVLISDLSTFY